MSNENALKKIRNTIFKQYPDIVVPSGHRLSPPPPAIMFIDEQNLMETAKQLSFQVDYLKLRDLFSQFFAIEDCWIFTSEISVDIAKGYYIREEHGRQGMNIVPNIKHLTWLSRNGFKLCTKPIKIFKDKNKEFQMKGNLDVDMAVYAMRYSRYAKHVFLFTGDGDFMPLVESLQYESKKVTAVSTTSKVEHIPIAKTFQEKVDYFLDLNDLRPYIIRDRYEQTSDYSSFR